jgi:hypothetical protein
MPSSPPEPNVSASYEAPHDAAPTSVPDVPREAAPERDFSPPPRSEPVETDFARSAPSDPWSPPERSFEEAPPVADRDDRGGAPQAEPAAAESNGDSASAPADERQTG